MLRTFRAQLVISFFLVILVTPLVFIGIFYTTLGRYLRAGINPPPPFHARVLGNAIAEEMARGAQRDDLDRLLRAWIRETPYHLTLLDTHRRVLVDTSTPPGTPAGTEPISLPESDEVLLRGAEYANAAEGRAHRSVIPVRQDGQRLGALVVARQRQAQTPRPVGSYFQPSSLAVRAIIGLLIAGVLGLLLSRRLLRPVEELRRVAEAMAAGDLSQRVKVPPHGELGLLAERFNTMAARVEDLVTRLSAEHERLRLAHAELAESERRQRELIANVSHELRTPLACIRASSEAILDGVADDTAKRERCLRTIEDETASLAHLIEDLLILSRLDSGAMPLQQAAVDMRRLVERCANRFLPRARQQQIDLLWECPAPLSVHGDEERLAQVLSNLLDNALRHTPPGGRVSLRADAAAGQVVLRVADTGAGIPAEHLPHVFERLYRVERSRSKGSGGAGLGLSIAKQIVDAHGGEIAITSQPGAGTEVTIRLQSAGTA